MQHASSYDSTRVRRMPGRATQPTATRVADTHPARSRLLDLQRSGGNARVTALIAGDGPVVQRGFFDDLLGAALPVVGGAASTLAGGDAAGALGQLRGGGAGIAGSLAEQGMGALGSSIGGPIGGLVGGLGSAVGGGLSSVVSGGGIEQAGAGVLNAAQPALLALLSSLLRG